MECNHVEMGNRISQRRKQLKIRQNNMAEAIGISNNHLSCIECGKSAPSLDVLIRICNELKVTPDYLIMGSGRSKNIPKEISDGLNMCSAEDLKILWKIIQIFIEKNSEKWNQENFI